jgi:hypothetical protein
MFFTMHTAGDLGERGIQATMGHRPERWPPPGAPKKVVVDEVGVYRTDGKGAGVRTVVVDQAGVTQVDAAGAGVDQVDADAAGVHQTDAKQVDG